MLNTVQDQNLTMSTVALAANGWTDLCPAAALVGASVYPRTVGALDVEKSQKRFMTIKGHIDGWPLGPRDGTSG